VAEQLKSVLSDMQVDVVSFIGVFYVGRIFAANTHKLLEI